MRIGVVGIVMSADGRVYLGLKDPNSYRPMAGQWMLPGGRSEGNETAIETLIREMNEELGIEVLEAHHIHTMYVMDSDMEVHFFIINKYYGEPAPNSDLVDIRLEYRSGLRSKVGPWTQNNTPRKVWEDINRIWV